MVSIARLSISKMVRDYIDRQATEKGQELLASTHQRNQSKDIQSSMNNFLDQYKGIEVVMIRYKRLMLTIIRIATHEISLRYAPAALRLAMLGLALLSPVFTLNDFIFNINLTNP